MSKQSFAIFSGLGTPSFAPVAADQQQITTKHHNVNQAD